MARPRRYNAPDSSERPHAERGKAEERETAAAPPAQPSAAPPVPTRPTVPTVPAAEARTVGEPGPHQRVYAVAFGRVWLAALAAVSAMSRWSTVANDPVRGEIRVEVGSMLRKATRPARVTVLLDDMGLTRVDAAFLNEGGRRAEGVEPGQIARFHRRLETLLKRDSRA